MLHLIEDEKLVTEGGGATALGALLGGHLPELENKRVALVLSGGNIDSERTALPPGGAPLCASPAHHRPSEKCFTVY